MTTTTSFDFFTPEQQYLYEISPGTILRIDRISYSAAHIHFTDNKGQKIATPKNVSIYTFDYQNTKRRVLLEPFQKEPVQKEYLLCWTENYEIEWNGEIKVVFKSKREWGITTG